MWSCSSFNYSVLAFEYPFTPMRQGVHGRRPLDQSQICFKPFGESEFAILRSKHTRKTRWSANSRPGNWNHLNQTGQTEHLNLEGIWNLLHIKATKTSLTLLPIASGPGMANFLSWLSRMTNHCESPQPHPAPSWPNPSCLANTEGALLLGQLI